MGSALLSSSLARRASRRRKANGRIRMAGRQKTVANPRQEEQRRCGGRGRGGDRDGGGGGRGGRGGDRGKTVGGSGGRGRGGGRGGGRATGTDDDPFVVGISQKEKNKRQRENLARYPNLGFTHFVERTEFQGRGSAHGHALWWHPHAPGHALWWYPHAPTDAEDEEEEDEAFFDFPTEMDVSPSEMGVSPLCTY